VEARFQVERIRLVNSVLAPGGAKYETVEEAALA